MTDRDQRGRRGTAYLIRVTGALDPTVVSGWGDVAFVRTPAGGVIRARLPDSAALHGLLHRLRGAGVSLVEVRRLLPGVTKPGTEEVA